MWWKRSGYREAVRRALRFIKIARAQDNVGFKALLGGKTFEEEVIEPLEEAYGWTDDDEAHARKLAKEFTTQTQGKGVKDKRERLRRIMKISGGIGIVGTLMMIVRRRFLKKGQE